MSDFAQLGPITTLTRLGSRPLVELEDSLVRHTRRSRTALLIPSLVSELERPALARICDEIVKFPYLDTVLISLDRADEAGYKGDLEYFRRLKRRTVVLWNDGPGVKALLEKLEKADLVLGERGKGRACWMGFGYLLAQGNVEYIALHDADVLDYDRATLARLLYPIADPILNFDFCKGFYARFTDRLNGRVCRLSLGPILGALRALLGTNPYSEPLPGRSDKGAQSHGDRHRQAPSSYARGRRRSPVGRQPQVAPRLLPAPCRVRRLELLRSRQDERPHVPSARGGDGHRHVLEGGVRSGWEENRGLDNERQAGCREEQPEPLERLLLLLTP